MKTISICLIGLVLYSPFGFSQSKVEVGIQLAFAKTEIQVTTKNTIELGEFAKKIEDMVDCKLGLVILRGNGDKSQVGDHYTRSGIRRTESVKNVLIQNGISKNIVYNEGSRKKGTNALPGAVLITAVLECQDTSPNKCDAFLTPGVNKIILNRSQSDRILTLSLSPHESSSIAEVSAILVSYNACTVAAARKSGRTLDEVSAYILMQIAAMPTDDIARYSDEEKNEFVNYVTNVLLFSQSN